MGLLVQYSIFPLAYIILSQVVSVGYLVVFQLWDGDVIIQTPYGQHDLDVTSKRWILGLTFIGFIGLDLLYVAVIMGYVYRCQMIIYYLEIIKHKAKCKHEVKCTDIYHSQKQAMEDVVKARKFMKYLNASSGTTGFVIIIAVFIAVNCTLQLLSDEIIYPEAGAITARLILLASLAIYPFHKTARLNIYIKALHNIGLDMRMPYLKFGYHPPRQHTEKLNEGSRITLEATMFGITVRPWQFLPRL